MNIAQGGVPHPPRRRERQGSGVQVLPVQQLQLRLPGPLDERHEPPLVCQQQEAIGARDCPLDTRAQFYGGAHVLISEVV